MDVVNIARSVEEMLVHSSQCICLVCSILEYIYVYDGMGINV